MAFQHFNLFLNKTALGNVMAPMRDVKDLSADVARKIAVPMSLEFSRDRYRSDQTRL